MEYNKTGCCYVLHQGIFNEVLYQKTDFVLYPEQSLTLIDLATGFKWQQSVITESPWIISCYPMEDVYIFRNGEWNNPDFQTFGCSVNLIMSKILGIRNTIPANIISKDEVEKMQSTISVFYQKKV